jgi:hypothetical protein
MAIGQLSQEADISEGTPHRGSWFRSQQRTRSALVGKLTMQTMKDWPGLKASLSKNGNSAVSEGTVTLPATSGQASNAVSAR